MHLHKDDQVHGPTHPRSSCTTCSAPVLPSLRSTPHLLPPRSTQYAPRATAVGTHVRASSAAPVLSFILQPLLAYVKRSNSSEAERANPAPRGRPFSAALFWDTVISEYIDHRPRIDRKVNPRLNIYWKQTISIIFGDHYININSGVKVHGTDF